MIARVLLILSSLVTLILGGAFIAGGIYGQSNPNIASKLADKIDLSAVPKAEAIKKDVIGKFEQSGIVQHISRVLITTGVIVCFISALGLWAALTGSKIFVILYLAVMAVSMTGFLVALLMVVGVTQIFEKPILDYFVKVQNTKFVPVVALFDNAAGDGSFVTVALNFLQMQLGCCGMRKVGDIRDSPRWQASSRAVAGLLKLRSGKDNSSSSSSRIGSLIRSVRSITPGTIPDWLKDRIPPGTSLPSGLNLPEKLPDGIQIPKDFNISLELIKNATAIESFFEDTLVLRTPITCCRFKGSISFTFDAKALVTNMEDQNCPFSASNSGVYRQTCYQKIISFIRKYSVPLILAGLLLGLLTTCNICLAVQMLVC